MRSLRSLVFTALTTLVLAQPASWAQTSDLRLGSSIPVSQAERSITIEADTRWANVRQGESIRFVVGAAEFGWRFDGRAHSFDLMQVAPAGSLTRPLTVYVASSSKGRSGN